MFKLIAVDLISFLISFLLGIGVGVYEYRKIVKKKWGV